MTTPALAADRTVKGQIAVFEHYVTHMDKVKEVWSEQKCHSTAVAAPSYEKECYGYRFPDGSTSQTVDSKTNVIDTIENIHFRSIYITSNYDAYCKVCGQKYYWAKRVDTDYDPTPTRVYSWDLGSTTWYDKVDLRGVVFQGTTGTSHAVPSLIANRPVVTLNSGNISGYPAINSMNITVNKGTLVDMEGTSVFTLGEDSDAQVTTLL